MLKKIVLGIEFYIEEDCRCNNWKHIVCLLQNNRFQRNSIHIGQNLHCQLGNEDDLQSKTFIK